MKKAQAGMWIWVIAGIILIIGIVALFMILAQNNEGKIVVKIESPMKLYLKAIDDKDDSISLDANYRIEFNNTLVREGTLSKDSITEIEVPRGQLRLICWNDEYYLGRNYKRFSANELRLNVSRSVCQMPKIGSIKIEHSGEITNGESKIRLNITAKGTYGNFQICNRHTAGITSVLPKNGELFCDKGNWMNWSRYNSTSEEYDLLPDNYFRCGECNYPYCDWTTRCSKTNGRYCEVYTTKIPNRYMGRVDDCYYPGKRLVDDSVVIEYNVKASDLNPLDEIEFFIMDSDRRHNPQENMLTYMTEQNGINIGAEDTNYIVTYWNQQ